MIKKKNRHSAQSGSSDTRIACRFVRLDEPGCVHGRVYTHVYTRVYGHVCIDMCAHMRMHTCTHVCIGMCVDMGGDKCRFAR